MMSNDVIPCLSGIWIGLTWQLWFGFRLGQISGNNQAAHKIVAQAKRGQKHKCYKNNNLATLTKAQSKSYTLRMMLCNKSGTFTFTALTPNKAKGSSLNYVTVIGARGQGFYDDNIKA